MLAAKENNNINISYYLESDVAHPICNDIYINGTDANGTEHYPDECERLGGARQQCAGSEIDAPPRSIATAISGREEVAL